MSNPRYHPLINWPVSMSKTILVVDDSGTFRQVVNMALTKAGCRGRGWIVKPFPPSQLIEAVSKLISS